MIPDSDGEGYGQQPHGNVSHSQRHHKQVGNTLQVGVEADGPADQDVSGHSQERHDQLQANINQLVTLQHLLALWIFIPLTQFLTVFSV